MLVNKPDNLLIQAAESSFRESQRAHGDHCDGSTIYALSQSGFLVIPIGTLQQSPLAIPDTNVALLAFDQCGVLARRTRP